jgi:predicted SnoaL-like aldol condensation-catalyzing enzyme
MKHHADQPLLTAKGTATRKGAVPMAILLAFATGAFLAELRLLFPTADVPLDNPSTVTDLAVVRRFYAAANLLLATGNADALWEVVSADFIDHAELPGLAPDRDGLVRYLRTWHSTDPTLRLNVVDLAAQGDRITAVVATDRADNAPASDSPMIAGRAWGAIDVFRLQSGHITEHWGDSNGLGLVSPLLAATVPVDPPAKKMVEVMRRTYAPGEDVWDWTGGPTALLVESGNLQVAHESYSGRSATVVSATGTMRTFLPGEDVSLGTGESVVFDRGSHIYVRNDGVTPAEVLEVWVGRQPPPRVSGVEIIGPGPGTSIEDTTRRLVVGGYIYDLPETGMTLTIARVSLAPLASMARHEVAAVELAVVEAGGLAVSAYGGDVWARTAATNRSYPIANGVLTAGDGLVLAAGTSVEYRAGGDEPVVFLFISFTPAQSVPDGSGIPES